MNLSGLGAFLSAVPGGYQQGQDDQLQQQLLRQKIAQQQQQQRALALQLSGIGPTGPQPMPQQAPLPQPGPVSAGGGPPMPGGSPVPAGALGAPTPGATPASMPGPGGPQPQPGGQPLGGGLMNALAAMKQRIMAANPNADPATVMMAIQGAADLLKADNSQETRLLIAQMGQQGKLETALAQIQGRLEGIDKQQTGATDRKQMGIDAQTALQQSKQSFDRARQDFIAKQATMKETDRAKYRGALQKWMGAQRQLAVLTTSTPGNADGIAKAQQAVDQAEQEYNALTLGGATGSPGAPSPQPPGGGPAPVPLPGGTVAVPPPGIPDGAPTATDDKGNKVYFDGTAWKPAPKG